MTDQEDDPRHLRGKPRLKLFQHTELRDAAGATRRAHLLDLSATGALAHAAEMPEPGAAVYLVIGGVMRAGQVMWADGRRFGIRFRLPLTDAEMAGILDEQAATAAEAGKRAGAPSR